MKWVIGLILIAISLYLYLGDPQTDLWPTRLGPWAVTGYTALINFRPYSTIAFFMVGIAFMVVGKRDY